MIRISLSYFYNVATQIEPLATINAGDKTADHWTKLFLAQYSVEQLIDNSVFSREIRTSRQSAHQLTEMIKTLIDDLPEDMERIIAPYQASQLTFLLTQFKTILLAEMETLNTYSVTQKRGYDTMILISYAEVIFPPDLGPKVPEAVSDIREAGKCIAFELPTAAGFHLHRANESILHKYYDAVSHGKPRPKNNNIGGYLAEFAKQNIGDQRLLVTLKDLNDLHRNPLIHPEQSLASIDDAIALMGAIHNAAVFMLKAIPIVEAAGVPPPADPSVA